MDFLVGIHVGIPRDNIGFLDIEVILMHLIMVFVRIYPLNP